jgi:ferritin-like metal-binding protein YciE
MFVLIYYMARYEGISYNDAANVMGKTLEEEKQADLLLTQIGEKHVNYSTSLEPA